MALGNAKIGPQIRGYAQTTDGSTVTVAEFDIPDLHDAIIRTATIGRQSGTGNYKNEVAWHDVSRNGVAASYLNNLAVHSSSSGLAGSAIAYDCSSTKFRVRVTGVALTTINWTAVIWFENCTEVST